jgi:hypothetical protein
MIGGRMIRQLFVAAFLISLLPTRADAIMSAPMPLDTPVPERWRAPLARLLGDLEVSDPASTVEASKAGPFHDSVNAPEMMIFRIVHTQTCTPDQDECLTIIAHIEKEELVPDAMFSAGGKTNGGDVMTRFAGRISVPLFFYSRDKIVVVRITAKGLLVNSGPAVELPK